MSEEEKKVIEILTTYKNQILERKPFTYSFIDMQWAINSILDLYQKEKEKNKKLFEEYNKRVATIIEYEQVLKSFLDDTNITDIEPWSEYKIKGQLLFDLQELLEER